MCYYTALLVRFKPQQKYLNKILCWGYNLRPGARPTKNLKIRIILTFSYSHQKS